MVQFKIRTFGFLFFLLISSLFADQYKGRSPYRLIFVERPDLAIPFDPNENLLELSPLKKKKEEVAAKILSAVVKGMLPMSGMLGSALSDPQTDFLTATTSLSALLSKQINHSLSDIQNYDAQVFPMVSDVYLIPWQTEERNLFYSADKISMSPDGVANVLISSNNSEKFEAQVTAQIKELQQLRFSTENPVYLLGLRGFIFVNPRGESNLRISTLLALKPGNIPFTQSNDQITFEKIYIPGNAQSPAVVKLSLNIPLFKLQAPTLEAEFGEFEAFSKGNFNLKERSRQNMSPSMEGKSAKGSIPLSFGFSSLKFDLETLNVSDLNLLTSLGYLSKRGRLPIGGFKVSSVNQQFQQEINNTLNAEVQKAREAGQEAVESRIFSNEILKEALESIVGRK